MSETREAIRYFGLTVAGWIVLLIVAGVILAAAWGIRVATSEVRGQGDALAQKNSAENWTSAQAKFEDLFAEVDVTVVKIQAANESAAQRPDDRTAQQTRDGLVSYCLSVVGDYNAEARKYLSEDFRAADLPASIPTSTCQE